MEARVPSASVTKSNTSRRIATALREAPASPSRARPTRTGISAPLTPSARPSAKLKIPLSVPDKAPEQLLDRAGMQARAKTWASELERLGALRPDKDLLAPKEAYCSTGVGDFTKVATWAQWYGVELGSDLANIDRKRFALVTIQQYADGYSYTYGLLHRDSGQLRHLFTLHVDQVATRMQAQGLTIPAWFDVGDLDHYRIG